MKKTIYCYGILLFCLIYQPGYSQTWTRIFGQEVTAWARDLKESYDHGYFLLGQVNPGPTVSQVHTWLIKTDINGNLIWDKKLL